VLMTSPNRTTGGAGRVSRTFRQRWCHVEIRTARSKVSSPVHPLRIVNVKCWPICVKFSRLRRQFVACATFLGARQLAACRAIATD
jgi:hypothetical protein